MHMQFKANKHKSEMSKTKQPKKFAKQTEKAKKNLKSQFAQHKKNTETKVTKDKIATIEHFSNLNSNGNI